MWIVKAIHIFLKLAIIIMKIENPEEYDKLIEGHYSQLTGSFAVLESILGDFLEIEDYQFKIDFSTLETKIKYSCFLTSSFLDLLTTLKGFTNSKTEWENIYYMRSGFLTIYETLNTYNYYQNSIKKLVVDEYSELETQFLEINKLVRNYKRKHKYSSLMKDIRNGIAGHYDNDFVKFYTEIKKLNKEMAIKAIEEFLNLLKLIMIFLFVIAEEASERSNKGYREYYMPKRIENIKALISQLK